MRVRIHGTWNRPERERHRMKLPGSPSPDHGSVRRPPVRGDFGRLQEGLHHNAILLGFFSQSLQLFGSCLRRVNVELDANGFKAYRHFFRQAKRSLQVHVAADRDFDVLCGDAHGGRNQLASELGTGGQGSNEKIARAGGGPGSAYSLVSLGLIDRTANVDRTSQGGAGLVAFCGECNARTGRVAAILFFQWLLQRSDIHHASVVISKTLRDLRESFAAFAVKSFNRRDRKGRDAKHTKRTGSFRPALTRKTRREILFFSTRARVRMSLCSARLPKCRNGRDTRWARPRCAAETACGRKPGRGSPRRR